MVKRLASFVQYKDDLTCFSCYTYFPYGNWTELFNLVSGFMHAARRMRSATRLPGTGQNWLNYSIFFCRKPFINLSTQANLSYQYLSAVIGKYYPTYTQLWSDIGNKGAISLNTLQRPRPDSGINPCTMYNLESVRYACKGLGLGWKCGCSFVRLLTAPSYCLSRQASFRFVLEPS
jgi:hypothetical protein